MHTSAIREGFRRKVEEERAELLATLDQGGHTLALTDLEPEEQRQLVIKAADAFLAGELDDERRSMLLKVNRPVFILAEMIARERENARELQVRPRSVRELLPRVGRTQMVREMQGNLARELERIRSGWEEKGARWMMDNAEQMACTTRMHATLIRYAKPLQAHRIMQMDSPLLFFAEKLYERT